MLESLSQVFRISLERFDNLLALVKSLIKKKGANFRKLISAEERLSERLSGNI